MAPGKKWLQGNTVRRGSAPKQVRTYNVLPSGSGSSVTYSETDASKKRRATAQPEPEELLRLNQEIQEDEEWRHESPTAYVTEPTVPADQETGPSTAAAELEDLLDNAQDAITSHRPSGKGQNEMLAFWLAEWGNTYLNELYQQHSPPFDVCLWCSSNSKAEFACDDRISSPRFCQECLISRHTSCPTHRVTVWTGHAWSRTSLKEQGLALILGHHTVQCPQGLIRPFTLGDLTGIHDVNVAFCQCPDAPDRSVQLLRSHILPCSDVNPSTGFTFATMRMFHFASTEAKQSASRCYSVLQRSTNNFMPHLQTNRFREFLRASRMWVHLQDLKRTGVPSPDSDQANALALRCPACPRLGVNHTHEDIASGEEYLYKQQISYDGSFQLVRKNKAFDSHDISLSGGAKYWVPMDAYKAHLEKTQDTAYAQSTRGSDCNNHRAANDTWVRRAGVAESGVGAVTCARHTMYLPRSMVPYYKGERFAYTDFAIACVLSLLFSEGSTGVNIFYDIYCHWIKGFWSRLPSIPLPCLPEEEDESIAGGVGKYHIAGHTDSCYALYSPNHMFGVGRIDAEGCKRAWADLNLAARSSSEKGPGARIDSLNSVMHDWNWRKTTGIVSFVLQKYEEAVRMAADTEEEWQTLHSSLTSDRTSAWAELSTEPYREKGSKAWTSVFISKEGSTISVTRALMELNKLEQMDRKLSSSNEQGSTAPSWIVEGFEIEVQQQRLIEDLKNYGSNITDRQSLECFTRRSALSSRIIRHRQSAAFFVDIVPTSSELPGSLAEETDGQPELASLFLPSRLGTSLDVTDQSHKASELEYKLRRVTCFRSLHRVKTVSIQKRSLLRGKQKNARGEVSNTRAQTMIDRLTRRVDMAAWEYQNSREAMKLLGFKNADGNILRNLTKAHLSELSKFLNLDRDVGQGYRKVPWLWQLSTRESTDSPSNTSESNDPKSIVDVDMEVDKANRVEWFRGRERYRRWREEVMWLRREIATVILDFDWRARAWDQMSSSEHAAYNLGYKAYTNRQRDAWRAMCRDAFRRSRHLLTPQPEIVICTRVLSLFSEPQV